MQSPFPSPPAPPSNGTATNSSPEFIETLEYRRFIEFCDACRRYRYIGLCFGTPGIGKTLSAVRYSHAEKIAPADAFKYEMTNGLPPDTAFYTPSIVNTPAILRLDIKRSCERANHIAREPIRLEAREALDKIRKRDEVARDVYQNTPCRGWQERPVLKPTYLEIMELYKEREHAIPDPITLIVIDEADRLKMTSLEQVRDVFDEGGAGMILIGMPGIEKRMARYPQFYSRIGFVHEFRPLATTEMQTLLEAGWAPPGVTLPPRRPGHGRNRCGHPDDGRKLPPAQSPAHSGRTHPGNQRVA